MLAAAVDSDATVEILTPGLDLAAIDAATAELAVDNAVVGVPDEAAVDFGDGTKAIVTNKTRSEWPQGATVYLYVAAKAVADAAEAMQAHIADLDVRVTALETAGEPSRHTPHERKANHGKR